LQRDTQLLEVEIVHGSCSAPGDARRNPVRGRDDHHLGLQVIGDRTVVLGQFGGVGDHHSRFQGRGLTGDRRGHARLERTQPEGGQVYRGGHVGTAGLVPHRGTLGRRITGPSCPCQGDELAVLGVQPLRVGHCSVLLASLLCPCPVSGSTSTVVILSRRLLLPSKVSPSPAYSARAPPSGTRPRTNATRPPTVSTSSTSRSRSGNSSANSPYGRRAVTRTRPSSSHCTGGTSWSYSSVISPTISSTMSSKVTRPAVPPYSSMAIATWLRCCCISRNSSSMGLLSGTYCAGRMMSAAVNGSSEVLPSVEVHRSRKRATRSLR